MKTCHNYGLLYKSIVHTVLGHVQDADWGQYLTFVFFDCANKSGTVNTHARSSRLGITVYIVNSTYLCSA